tara:strand:- start:176 stop:466 length:291 start_codon:yes stop_codon:yes gene_type:complete
MEIIEHVGYHEGAIINGDDIKVEYRKRRDSEYRCHTALGANQYVIFGKGDDRRVFDVHPLHPTVDGREGYPIRWELMDFDFADFDNCITVPPPSIW